MNLGSGIAYCNKESKIQPKISNLVPDTEKKPSQFVQISPDTVQVVAQTIGITKLDPRIAITLSEDASYRCRELANICGNLLRHGKRRKLTTKDVNDAFDLYNTNPASKQNATDNDINACRNVSKYPISFHKNLDIDIATEEPLDLTTTMYPTPQMVCTDPYLLATSLSMEGQVYSEHEKGKLICIQTPQQANVAPQLIDYYSTLLNVTLGNSKEMLLTLRKDLESNPKIGTLIPFILSFIRTGIQRHCQSTELKIRLISLLQSLVSNPWLNLSPKTYLSDMVSALLTCWIVDRSGQNSLKEQMQTDKNTIPDIDYVQHSATILQQVLVKWSTPENQLRLETYRALRDHLKNENTSYFSQYGALYTMVTLGPDALEFCLLNNLELYVKNLRENMTKIENELSTRASIERDARFYECQRKKLILYLIWGTIETAARTLIYFYNKHLGRIFRSRQCILGENSHQEESQLLKASSYKIRSKDATEAGNQVRENTASRFMYGDRKLELLKLQRFLFHQFGDSLCMAYSDSHRIPSSKESKPLGRKTMLIASEKPSNHTLNSNELKRIDRLGLKIIPKNKYPEAVTKANNINLDIKTQSHMKSLLPFEDKIQPAPSKHGRKISLDETSFPKKSIAYPSSITLTFGISQRSKDKLRQKKFTSNFGRRWKNDQSNKISLNQINSDVVVGKRQGMQKKHTSGRNAVFSCSIMTII